METLLTARLETLTPHVYPNQAPTNYVTPCVVYQVIDTETLNHIDSISNEYFATIQLSISATTYGAGKRLAKLVRDSMIDWDDDRAQLVSWIGGHDSADNSTDTTIHRTMMFFRFFVSE